MYYWHISSWIHAAYNYVLHFLFLVCFCKDCIQRCSFSSLHLPCCAKRCWNRSVRRLFNHVHVSYTMVNHKKIFSWQKLVHYKLFWLAYMYLQTQDSKPLLAGRNQMAVLSMTEIWTHNNQETNPTNGHMCPAFILGHHIALSSITGVHVHVQNLLF